MQSTHFFLSRLGLTAGLSLLISSFGTWISFFARSAKAPKPLGFQKRLGAVVGHVLFSKPPSGFSAFAGQLTRKAPDGGESDLLGLGQLVPFGQYEHVHAAIATITACHHLLNIPALNAIHVAVVEILATALRTHRVLDIACHTSTNHYRKPGRKMVSWRGLLGPLLNVAVQLLEAIPALEVANLLAHILDGQIAWAKRQPVKPRLVQIEFHGFLPSRSGLTPTFRVGRFADSSACHVSIVRIGNSASTT